MRPFITGRFYRPASVLSFELLRFHQFQGLPTFIQNSFRGIEPSPDLVKQAKTRKERGKEREDGAQISRKRVRGETSMLIIPLVTILSGRINDRSTTIASHGNAVSSVTYLDEIESISHVRRFLFGLLTYSVQNALRLDTTCLYQGLDLTASNSMLCLRIDITKL